MAPRLNIPPLTRVALLLLLVLTLLNAALRLRFGAAIGKDEVLGGLHFLTVVPKSSWKTPWSILTAALVEQNLVSLAVSGLTIFYGGRYLERAWGGPEYAKFFLFVTIIPNLLSFVVYWLWAGITGNQTRL